MVKVDLVTGFLGSGKTTFIKKYAKYLIAKGMKIGILENDHGAINVDMLMLNELRGDKCELEMVAGGCDDDCHRRRFKTKLISMAMSGYERVVIEPSGIFDTDEFFEVLREEPLENWYEIGNVFCLLDYSLLGSLSEKSEYILATQMSCAGRILITRLNSDISSEKALSEINELLKRNGIKRELADKDICVWNIDDVAEPFDKLFAAEYVIKDYTKRYTVSELGFETLFFLEKKISLEHFGSLCKTLFDSTEYGNVLRIKGFVQDDNKWYQINATADSMETEEIAVGQEVIIIIGEKLTQDKIQELFE